jgi:hypothetical protein
MKRVWVFAVGVLVAAAATWLLVSRLMARHHQPDSAKTEVPLSLRHSAECMYRALKAIPGVNQPVLRYENGDGWNHPELGYLASWRDGMYRMKFEAQRPMAGHNRYWFLNSFAGPPPPGLDDALMMSVMKTWKAKCNVEADYEIN